jgi:hypothetical protein
VQKLSHTGEKEQLDMSASAKKERKYLREQEKERDANKAAVQLLQHLKVTPTEPAGQKGGDNEKSASTAVGGVPTQTDEVAIAPDAKVVEEL